MNKLWFWVVWFILLLLLDFGFSVYGKINNPALSFLHYAIPVILYTFFIAKYSRFIVGK